MNHILENSFLHDFLNTQMSTIVSQDEFKCRTEKFQAYILDSTSGVFPHGPLLGNRYAMLSFLGSILYQTVYFLKKKYLGILTCILKD